MCVCVCNLLWTVCVCVCVRVEIDGGNKFLGKNACHKIHKLVHEIYNQVDAVQARVVCRNQYTKAVC